MVAINPQKITGAWVSGYALDVHTVSSTHLGINEAGHDVFDTKRSELGELLYRLKYSGDKSAAAAIAAAAVMFIRERSRAKFDMIVPVPPSGVRKLQPVITIARIAGAALDLPVVECVSTTRPTKQLKGVIGAEERKVLLAGLYAVDATQTKGMNILLLDDLFRSGATLNAITNLLMNAGKALSVRVLTITRTRSHQ
jgi:competence protein ComFC